MKDKIMKGAALLLTCLVLFLTCGITADAASKSSRKYDLDYYTVGDYYLDDRIYFYDQSQRFTQMEKQAIKKMLKETASEIGFSIAVFAGGQDISDSKTEDIAYYGSRVLFRQSDTNGVVFLYIDLDGYTSAYDYLYAYHEAFLYYTDDYYSGRQRKILKAMQRSFPSGGSEIKSWDIYLGLKTFCSELISYKNLGMENGSFYQDEVNGGYYRAEDGQIVKTMLKPYRYWYFVLPIGLGIGLLVMAIFRISIKKRYKFKTSTSASAYTSQEKMLMRHVEDTFIGTRTTRVKIETNSGGGGGGHGGGGFGGGGGTGSHR